MLIDSDYRSNRPLTIYLCWVSYHSNELHSAGMGVWSVPIYNIYLFSFYITNSSLIVVIGQYRCQTEDVCDIVIG